MNFNSMSVIFIGTNSHFSQQPLTELLKKYTVSGIIESASLKNQTSLFLSFILNTMDGWINPHSLKRVAKSKNIPYFLYQKGDTRHLIEFLLSNPAQIGIVASMNHLLPPEVLAVPPLGFINIHPSLLPDLRGPHVWTWYYFYNDLQAGVTLHYLDSGEDTGRIICQDSFPIRPGMSGESLMQTSIQLGTRLLLDVLSDIQRGKIFFFQQPDIEPLRHARRIKKDENLFLYKSWSLEHCFHFLQGTKPWFSPFRLQKSTIGLLDWKFNRFTRTAVNPKHIGSFHLCPEGLYFCHPEGRIFCSIQIQPVRLIIFIVFILAVLNMVISR